MENAYILFINILVMLVYAVPGVLLVKAKKLKSDTAPTFNMLLLYVAQPCLVYYSFTKVPFEGRILKNMGYVFLISMAVMLVSIGAFYLLTRKAQEKTTALRICNIAAAFGNCTFMGLPLLEALLPDYPEASMYSVVFFLSMCIIGWTVACFIISRDRQYISVKKILLNPATVSSAIFLPFFLTGLTFPEPFHSAFTLLGRMSTPLCMIVLGLRLASLGLKPILCDRSKYLAILLRQVLVPLLYLLVCVVLPIETNLKVTAVICGATPVASMVLNYSELMGEGQEYAAGLMILSSATAVLTMPIIVMLMNHIL